MLIGGDVVNTQVLAGYGQRLSAIFAAQANVTTGLPPAQDGGAIQNVLIGGDVINSVFAASTQPFDDPDLGPIFGFNDLTIPHGFIQAKVEGNIQNDTATPDSPNQAFFAQNVRVTHGPVTPPNVVTPPFKAQGASPSGPRLAKTLLPTSPKAPARRGLHFRTKA